MPPAGHFCILLYSARHLYLFFRLDYPAFCLLSFTYNTRPKTIHAPGGIFLICLFSLTVLLCPDYPGLCLLSLLYNTHHTAQTSMPPAGFEPETPASDRPQTLALDRSATGIRTLESAIPVTERPQNCIFDRTSTGQWFKRNQS